MLGRTIICLIALVAMLTGFLADTRAHDASKYPDWAGSWSIKGGNRWDPTKPTGRGQQAPLTAEYQKVFEASLADQELGGPGNDPSSWCYPTGMPRLMTAIFAIEFIILPGFEHPDPGIHQECAENIQEPFKLMNQRHAHRDEYNPEYNGH